MRLTATRHYIPKRVVTRAETIDLFRHYSRPFYRDEDEFEDVIRVIEKLFALSRFKQITARAAGEPYYRNFIEMTRAMIADSGVDPSEIGTIVYCGVGRGYLEPATACQMGSHLGLRKVEFFDVVDACNGWSRAARVVDGLLRRGASKHILVLSLEFCRSPRWNGAPTNGAEAKFHNVYSVRNKEEIEWRIWSATVAEAGVATLWSKDDSREVYFDYDCECAEFQDCAFALPNRTDYDLEPMVLAEELGSLEWGFYAFARRIGDSIKSHLPPLLRKVQPWLEEASVVVAHSLSSAVYESVFRSVGVHEKAVYPFNEYGNCVSCGVPAGLALAIESGRVKRGDRVVLAPTGSGSSAGVVSFVY
jgi:3-oxoacyl-[acyl-carrier-protein] synthase III